MKNTKNALHELGIGTLGTTEPPAPKGRDVLAWYAGCDARVGLIEPLSLLLVLDKLASGPKREARISDAIGFFPRSRIGPGLSVLKAMGFVTSNGHQYRINRLPTDEVSQ